MSIILKSCLYIVPFILTQTALYFIFMDRVTGLGFFIATITNIVGYYWLVVPKKFKDMVFGKDFSSFEEYRDHFVSRQKVYDGWLKNDLMVKLDEAIKNEAKFKVYAIIGHTITWVHALCTLIINFFIISPESEWKNIIVAGELAIGLIIVTLTYIMIKKRFSYRFRTNTLRRCIEKCADSGDDRFTFDGKI